MDQKAMNPEDNGVIGGAKGTGLDGAVKNADPSINTIVADEARTVFTDFIQVLNLATCTSNSKYSRKKQAHQAQIRNQQQQPLPNQLEKSISMVEENSLMPPEYHIRDSWNHLRSTIYHPMVPADDGPVGLPMISVAIAYKCINYRGAIAHGRPTELFFNYQQDCTNNTNIMTIQDVFDNLNVNGGTKRLSSVVEIKKELLRDGPVVSTSFVLTNAFYSATQHGANKFDASQIGSLHPVLILGWKITPFGEVWLVQSIFGTEQDIPISVGQFCIEEECLAPVSSLEMLPWQNPKRALDVDMVKIGLNSPAMPFLGHPGWYEWSSMEIPVESSQLEEFMAAMEEGFSSCILNQIPFVVREVPKIARSRTACLKEISFDKKKKCWKMEVVFTDPSKNCVQRKYTL